MEQLISYQILHTGGTSNNAGAESCIKAEAAPGLVSSRGAQPARPTHAQLSLELPCVLSPVIRASQSKALASPSPNSLH